ncbi:MAG: response regulator, partial [Gammaproteobacteria bacterium]|nr:response regulator [Gammaproteobacteria bacterium]
MSRILIIEDSNAIAKILEMTINSAQGLEVIGISTSGLEAIEDVKNLQPDLITLDLHLPEMDGVEVLTNIRKLCLAPVIVISSTADTTLPICKQVLAEGAY